MKKWGVAAAMMLLAGSSTTTMMPTAAQAASRQFCEDYAHAAIIQVRAALSSRACEHHLDGTRWSPEWRLHFDWCLGVSPREAEGERNARTEHLRACGR
ncbi:MAG TPA: hypothetical protein VMI56_25840 [Reyranella sp.]|nr:hypothetical protein [Reyranella sp.]